MTGQPDIAERARKLHEQGLGIRDIATILNVHDAQVQRWIATADHAEAEARTRACMECRAMSAWLLQRPPSVNDKHERFLIRVEHDKPETTPQSLLAMRFVTASAARMFAMQFDGLFDEWKVVRR